jgi:non-ribosomal peptide synthetase component F
MFNHMNLVSEAKPWVVSNGTSKYDLTLTMVPTASEMQCVWEYSSDLFEAANIRRMAEHFEMLLASIIVDPARRILELPLTTEAERLQLLTYSKGTPAPSGDGATIPSLFPAQVARTPGDAAVWSDGVQLSYRELNARANRLARRVRAAGVIQGVRVGGLPRALVGALGEPAGRAQSGRHIRGKGIGAHHSGGPSTGAAGSARHALADRHRGGRARNGERRGSGRVSAAG